MCLSCRLYEYSAGWTGRYEVELYIHSVKEQLSIRMEDPVGRSRLSVVWKARPENAQSEGIHAVA
jgi:hypothetical protein